MTIAGGQFVTNNVVGLTENLPTTIVECLAMRELQSSSSSGIVNVNRAGVIVPSLDCSIVSELRSDRKLSGPNFPDHFNAALFDPNFIARSTKVRTATPVAPFAFHGFTSSCQA